VHIERDSARLRGARILVVDDDADQREMLMAVLEHGGVVVTTANSVAEALTLVEREPPDVVISDVGMPGEDGLSLVTKLRARPSVSGKDVPAIALTGYDAPQDREQVLKAGFQAHLTKPVSLDELLATLAGVVGIPGA
jgi:CheY-like chemotaxis protein